MEEYSQIIYRTDCTATFRKDCMATDDITYNQASGKLYQGGSPYLNHIFMNEAEAEDYLSQVGLHLHKSGQSNLMPSLQQTQPQFNIGENF